MTGSEPTLPPSAPCYPQSQAASDLNTAWYAKRYRECWSALHDIAVEFRPTHDHYDDPGDCSLCRAFIVVGLETRDEQQGTT